MADDRGAATFPSYAQLADTAAWAITIERIQTVEATSVQLPGADARYVEGALLGMGGMGKVVLARDARIGRDVAIKQLRDDRELSGDERARFLREARVQGQLEHPSIVPVYDIEQRADGTTFFTMRRVVGRTLHAIVQDLRTGVQTAVARFTQRELLTAFATVCLTIDYAHTRGVIHRDLKPSNIMLGDFGEVYVLDWGIARLLDDKAIAPDGRLSNPGELLGTPLYMAPEQWGDSNVDARADVFALGAILFELLSYEPLRDPNAPYVPADARISHRVPGSTIAPELEAICVRATADEPAARFETTRTLHDAVARYLEGDRELALRHARASEHAAAARTALDRAAHSHDEADRGTAMRELVRALAFEPDRGEHVALLAEMLASPPVRTPPEVERELAVAEQEFLRKAARKGLYTQLGLVPFVPLALAMGVERPHELPFVFAPYIIVAVLMAIMSRRKVVSSTLQIAIFVANLAGVMALSLLFGPLMMVPTLAAGYSTALQIHPRRKLRLTALALACAAMLVVPLLEQLGAWPQSYVFTHGQLVIVPQMIALPRAGVLAMLIGSAIVQTITACLFAGNLREQLTRAERVQAIQTWHFKRLGAELVTSSR